MTNKDRFSNVMDELAMHTHSQERWLKKAAVGGLLGIHATLSEALHPFMKSPRWPECQMCGQQAHDLIHTDATPTKTTDLNEDEAREAMKNGYVISDGVNEQRMIRNAGGYQHFRRDAGERKWNLVPDNGPWRIVIEDPDESPADEWPTRMEALDHLADEFPDHHEFWIAHRVVNELAVWKPAMFREEGK